MPAGVEGEGAVQPPDEIEFEVCADGLAACLAAHAGGADRIELCSALSEGGLTPSHGLIRAAVEQSGLPIYAMLRPRGGDFVYSVAEFAVMRDDLKHAMELGASGFVAGVLRRDGNVDRERMRELVELARPLDVTFHRAFDQAADLERALEDVIETGCARLLSSGGGADVKAGAKRLGQLREQARGRIAIAAGGGLRADNAAEVVRTTGLSRFHGSVRRQSAAGDGNLNAFEATDAADVRAMIALLREAHAARRADSV